MAIRDLIPWKKESKEMMAEHPFESNSFTNLQEQMNQMMDTFWNDQLDRFISPATEKFLYPQIDLSETEQEFTIITDLPGLTENDIEILTHAQSVIIRGKKETIKEEKNRQYHKTERIRGSFFREVPLSQEIDDSKVEANIKNGVLTIHLPKKYDESSTRKRIPIKTA